MAPPLGVAPLQTFHLFPALPVELQMIIWEFAPPTPRLFQCMAYGLRAVSSRNLKPQPILHTCRLSRKIALRRLILAQRTFRRTLGWVVTTCNVPIYLDPRYDFFEPVMGGFILWEYLTGMSHPDDNYFGFFLSQGLHQQIDMRLIGNMVIAIRADWEWFCQRSEKELKAVKQNLKINLPVAVNRILVSSPRGAGFRPEHCQQDDEYEDKILEAADMNHKGLSESSTLIMPDHPQPTNATGNLRVLGEGFCFLDRAFG